MLFRSNLRDYCDATGALLVFDCVQTGMGRTGDWFGYEYAGIKPDVITLAKGLGGGLPLGAMIALGSAANLFKPGDHGSTFGGNPIATAAAIASIKAIEKERIFLNVAKVGEFLRSEIALIPGVIEVRGAGLLTGVTLDAGIAKKVAKKCEELGLLLNAPSDSYLRIAPALNIPLRQAEQGVKILQQAIMRARDV